MHETLTLELIVKETLVEMKKGAIGFMHLSVNQETKEIFIKEKSTKFMNKDELLAKFFQPKEAGIFVFNWADSKKHLHYTWCVGWIPSDASDKDKHFFHFAQKNQELHKLIGADHQSNHTERAAVEKILSK